MHVTNKHTPKKPTYSPPKFYTISSSCYNHLLINIKQRSSTRFYIFKSPNLVIIVLTSNSSFSTLQHSSLLFFQSIFFVFLFLPIIEDQVGNFYYLMNEITWKKPPNGCQACPFLFPKFIKNIQEKLNAFCENHKPK
jgi:hypothetical protein